MGSDAICVGGPFAGRCVHLPHECRVMQFPEWPRPERVMREALGQERAYSPTVAHTYRWHQSKIIGPHFRFTAYAMVHESMKDHEADRAAFIAALTMSLAFFSEPTP